MEGQGKARRSLVIPIDSKLSSLISPSAVIDELPTNSLPHTYIIGLHVRIERSSIRLVDKRVRPLQRTLEHLKDHNLIFPINAFPI